MKFDDLTMPQQAGIIRAIAWRPNAGAALQEVDKCHVLRDTGLESEGRKPGKRSVTLLSLERWRDVCRELGEQLPWTTRRANFLVEGFALEATIARPILIGQVRIWIHGETRPCKLMDEQSDGLRTALRSDCRGGVYGQVLIAGEIRVGCPVTLAEQEAC